MNDLADWKRLLLASFAASAVVLVASCGADQQQIDEVTALTGDASNGAELYDVHCLACHGADGKTGTANVDVPAKASDPDALVSKILTGGLVMPAFAETLTNQEIADVASYVAEL